MSAKGYRPILFTVIVLVVGPIMLTLGFKERREIALVQAEGVQVNGIIFEGSESRGRRGRRSFELKVSYQTPEGRQLQKDFSVNESLFNQHCSASAITNPQIAVRYAKTDPSIARLVGQEDSSAVMMIFGMILLGLGVGGIAYCVWYYSR